jgi:DUF4097 and DUF4098 domain-containing protein YvlB
MNMRPAIAALLIFAVMAVALFASFALSSIRVYSYSISGKRTVNASGINTININDPAGAVNVEAYNGSEITVSYVSESNVFSPVTPSINASSGALNINVRPQYISFGYSVYINVLVPYTVKPHIFVKLSVGNIMVQMPYSQSVYLVTSTGNIYVNVSELPQATLEAVTGNVELMSAKTYNVYASTVTGDISANIKGPLIGNYVFKDVTGNINVYIPANSSVSFVLSSVNGGYVVSGIPYNAISQQSGIISGSAGTGMASLSETTTTGTVSLRAN